ncbi:hypothetical protein FF38_06984 [Lucilia cuprina]|uniref:Zonadhesin n=1 Tax=Lucilia cuprina TaxID=7375 RepID=A0A0L0CCR0_LUCCU|nr:hypothetical protein CVS40_6980 [Lucilia cuprina]KNC30223.1 hypothetical protein FF38_06984 [Lucilia cuprina]
MFKSTIVILAVSAIITQAAVIRTSDKDTNVVETTTVSIDDMSTTMEPELTTIKEDDLTTTTTESFGALSRDEEATILIVDQTLLDPAPAELIKTETETVQIEKSGKLLLLSTQKIAEKTKQPEENLEESEEENETVENVTQSTIETTTMDSLNEDTTTPVNMEEEETTQSQLDTKNEVKSEHKTSVENGTEDLPAMEKITKLYPINDTLYADSSKKSEQSSTTIVDDQPKETLNLNLGTVILEEAEADYVLVESEVLEGSYTDVDSELHLQPIVQSVEIVPSSLDDTLLINYVQSW